MNLFTAVVAVALFCTLYMVHVGLHKKNTCNMTYMWRSISLVPVEVDGDTDPGYRLYRYMEGFVNEHTMSISSSDIPVLFVPGSGGSAKQVRSMASVMMNKTEMTSAPFRMHFYAIDFDEELSLLSGAILYRQRNFVVKALSILNKLYSHKAVLVGHSFGGTILHALPAHINFDVSKMDLVITLASPLIDPPVFMDEAMATFYESMKNAWHFRRDELRNVAVVSYSGGSKDFQVPDRLAAFPESHVFHLPSWSIRGVDTSVDHLCILWCNQLTRHSTRILYNYGIGLTVDAHPRSARAFMENYFQKERNDSQKPVEAPLYSTEDVVKIGIFDYPWVSRVYSGDLENSKKLFELGFLSPYMAYSLVLASDCDASMVFVYSNSYVRRGEMKKEANVLVMVVDLPFQLKSAVGHIVLEGKSHCNFELTIRPDIFYAWYLVLISHVNLVVHFTLSALIALAIAEKLLGKCEISFRGGCYVNGCIIISIFFCFTYNYWIRECVFAVSIFYTLSCFYIVAKAISFVAGKVFSYAPTLMRLSSAMLNFIMLMLVPVNICYANAVLALLMVIKQTTGPYAILLSISTASICTALGLAEAKHGDVIHLIDGLRKMGTLDISSFLSFLLARVDFSRSFTTAMLFYMFSRVLIVVHPPHYLASFKDFFKVILLVVPGLVASQISLSSEACSVIASLLLTVLSLC